MTPEYDPEYWSEALDRVMADYVGHRVTPEDSGAMAVEMDSRLPNQGSAMAGSFGGLSLG